MTRAEIRDRALKMRAMYEGGATCREVAFAFGVTIPGAWQAIRRVGGATRNQAEAVRAARRRHLDALNDRERANYAVFKKAGYTRDDAMRAVGRADLIREGAK